MGTHEVGRARADHRAERGLDLQRIAEPVFPRQGDEPVNETIVDVAMDVDSFDGAAGLPGVEERAVHQVCNRRGQRRVGADVSGILAAELQVGGGKLAGRGALHRAPALD